MSGLRAFHGVSQIKDNLLTQLRAHYEADEIVHGVYWQNGKGCAVGCTVHSTDHSGYEFFFGIPESLAYLEDAIFEGLPNKEAKDWPIAFMQAIPVGADLSDVTRRFFLAILGDETHGVLRLTQPGSLQHTAISQVIALLNDNCQDHLTWEKAWAASWASGAAEAAAAWAAEACAAEEKMWAATWAAEATRAAHWASKSASENAAENHYSWMAHILSNLLQQAPLLPPKEPQHA
jgi:hypothetical protein